jgi:hypothetical protein
MAAADLQRTGWRKWYNIKIILKVTWLMVVVFKDTLSILL